MTINYSIIIPHKNTPNLLQRCLDSIPQQNGVEVIVVDDNSDPSLVNFSQFPGMNRDDVVLLFDKSNKGPGIARNIGIKKAKGKWIIFIDADDYFNYCIRDILLEYIYDDSDVVYFSASSVDSDTYVNTSRSYDFVVLIDNYLQNETEGELGLRYVLASPWGKLIKKSLLINNNIEFPDVQICEDVKFSYLIGWYAKKIKADKRAICCYTSRAVSRSSVSAESVYLDKIQVYIERDKFIIDHNIPLPYGSFYTDELMEMEKTKNFVLHDKIMGILNRSGISPDIIDEMIEAKRTAKRVLNKRRNPIRRCAHLFKTKLKGLFN